MMALTAGTSLLIVGMVLAVSLRSADGTTATTASPTMGPSVLRRIRKARQQLQQHSYNMQILQDHLKSLGLTQGPMLRQVRQVTTTQASTTALKTHALTAQLPTTQAPRTPQVAPAFVSPAGTVLHMNYGVPYYNVFEVNGNPKPSVALYLNDRLVTFAKGAPVSGHELLGDNLDTTTVVFTLPQVTLHTRGQIRLEASNEYNGTMFNVTKVYAIQRGLSNVSLLANVPDWGVYRRNDLISLSCSAAGYPTPVIRWRSNAQAFDMAAETSNGKRVATQSVIEKMGFVTSTLTVRARHADNSGIYWCTVQTSSGVSQNSKFHGASVRPDECPTLRPNNGYVSQDGGNHHGNSSLVQCNPGYFFHTSTGTGRVSSKWVECERTSTAYAQWTSSVNCLTEKTLGALKSGTLAYSATVPVVRQDGLHYNITYFYSKEATSNGGSNMNYSCACPDHLPPCDAPDCECREFERSAYERFPTVAAAIKSMLLAERTAQQQSRGLWFVRTGGNQVAGVSKGFSFHTGKWLITFQPLYHGDITNRLLPICTMVAKSI